MNITEGFDIIFLKNFKIPFFSEWNYKICGKIRSISRKVTEIIIEIRIVWIEYLDTEIFLNISETISVISGMDNIQNNKNGTTKNFNFRIQINKDVNIIKGNRYIYNTSQSRFKDT